MARRTNMEQMGDNSSRQLSLKQNEALDKGADMLRTINDLQRMTEEFRGESSNETTMARDEMESVMQHLAAEKSGGDLEKARCELENRGFPHILG